MIDIATSAAPNPDDAATVDELVASLQELRASTGISYRELHRRLIRRRRVHGIVEEPAYATVYRCLQPGRKRLDVDLLVDIAAVVRNDESEGIRWRQAYARLHRDVMAAPTSVLSALPDDVVEFTGREDELHAVVTLLADGAVPCLLAIEGMAGVGKTTLAVHAAHRLAEAGRFADLQLSINLHGHDPAHEPVEPEAALDGFLRHLGVGGRRIQSLTLAERSAVFRKLISDKSALLLLDNAASEEQVRPLLPCTPRVLTIVTSRERVIHNDSARYVALEVFSPAQAIELLSRRVGAEAIDAEPRIALRLVEQVGYLPLAVALIASRIQTSYGWTLQDHLEHLNERRDTLRLDTGVELAFATSYASLAPSLRRMLRLLALKPGRDCDPYAAAALTDTDLDTAARQLSALANGSLLNERTTGRYELHDLVRIYALNRARDEDAPSARRTAVALLLDHYRWAATAAMDAYAPAESTRRPPVPDSGTTVPPVSDRHAAAKWLDTERANLLAVATHAAKHGWHAHVSDLSAVLAPYLHNTAQFDSAEILHGHASQVAEEAARGVALKDLASTHWQRGRRRQARSLLDEAIEIAETYNDQQTHSRALMNLAVVLRHLGRYSEAIDANLKAIELFRSLGDRAGEGRVMGNLGIIYTVLGRAGESMEHQRRALELVREQHDRGAEARNLENLSSLYSRLGRHHEARRAAISAVDLAHRTGERVAESEALASLGVALAGLGDLESAAARQREALDIAESVSSGQCMTNAHNALGSTLLSLGRLDDALGHHRAALTLAESLDDPLNQAKAHDGLTRGYTLLDDRDRADAHGRMALELYEGLGVPDADNVAMYLSRAHRAPKS